MKTIKMKSLTRVFGLAGLAGVAFSHSALAIEKPAEGDAPKKKAAPAAEGEAPKADEKPAKKLAMLGVGGMTAGETLTMHLGLEQGQGLTLYNIVPGSAAEKAGLKAHDVLTEFDGKKIGSQQDLRNAVMEKQPGDEVRVKFFSRGKLEEKNVVLGERPDMPRVQPMPGIQPDWLQKNLGAGALPLNEEMMKRLRKMQLEMQQQGGGAMRLDLDQLLEGAQKGEGGAFNFKAQTSVTMMDDEGSITMNTVDGKKSVIVKDKEGKVQFDGPYQTEHDKAAVPDEIRERIDRLGIGDQGNGMKLRILPMGGIPPVEDEEDDVAE